MKEQLTLSEFIFLLNRIEPEKTVQYDFVYFRPTKLDSYRGYYDQLALGYVNDGGTEITVAELLADCKAAIGKTYHGWKGGDYEMSGSTWLWVANPGEAGSTAIVGVLDEYAAIIETRHGGW